jgi:RNA polymerase sigma-70 factor, ECF subfamily
MQTTEALWDEFHTRLHHFVARRVSDPDDAEDIVQEVFVRLHQKIDTLQDERHLHAWVYQITRNMITDYYRSPLRRSEGPMPESLAEVTADEGDDPDTDALREMAACVAPILDTLPDSQREALALTALQGLTQVAAARQLGLSHSGMKSRVQRARKQVRDALLECCQVEMDRRGGIIDYAPKGTTCTCCDDCT